MSEIRSELKYLSSHEWARIEEDGTVTIGITLEDAPERVNESPFDDGWFFKVRPSEIDELDNALDSEAYEEGLEDE